MMEHDFDASKIEAAGWRRFHRFDTDWLSFSVDDDSPVTPIEADLGLWSLY